MNKKNIFLGLVVLAVLTFVVFSPILVNDFIHYDDNIYIMENDHVQSGFSPENIRWAFSSITGGTWHPLTWISRMLDWQLFAAWIYLKKNAERSACLDARQACALKQCDTLQSFQSAGFCRRGGL